MHWDPIVQFRVFMYSHVPFNSQFLKLEDVGDQIRMEEWHIQRRGSLAARLLHYTIDHSREKLAETEEGSEIQDRTIAGQCLAECRPMKYIIYHQS